MTKQKPEDITAAIEVALRMGQEREMRIVADMKTQLKANGSLSARQWEYLGSLVSKYTDEKLSEFLGFKNKLSKDEDFRERVSVIADYYIHNGHGYYNKAAIKVKIALGFKEEGLEIPDHFMPDFSAVDRMINNGYADKVWESHVNPPLYSAGDLVMIRSTGVNRIWGQRKRAVEVQCGIENLNAHPCLIIKVNATPISNALLYKPKQGGARIYRVMPLGTDLMYDILECDLKKSRIKKNKK